MKSIVIAALLGTISAVQIQACLESGMNGNGVTCLPAKRQYFATGMNGDEDLGEDIIMKGEPYHYHQRKLQHLAQGDEAPAAEAAPAEADPSTNEKMKEGEEKAAKVEVNAKAAKVEPAEKVAFVDPTIASLHTTFYNKRSPKRAYQFAQGDDAAAAAPAEAAPAEADPSTNEKMKEGEEKAAKVEVNAKAAKVEPAEKVAFVDPTIASLHTTFYNKRAHKRGYEFAQGDDAAAEEAAEATADKKEAAEEDKMKEADAKAAKAEANAKVKKVDPAEKVSVLETAICKEHTTFYDRKAPKRVELLQSGDEADNAMAETEVKGVPGYEAVSPEAEKVSVIDQGQAYQSNSYGWIHSFPQPMRTAFY